MIANPNGFPSSNHLGRNLLLSTAALLTLLFLVFFARLESIAHRPSPAHPTLTTAEIAAETTHLQQLGLTLPDGTFLKPHPFEPPWTSHSLLVPSTWSYPAPGIQWLLGPHKVRADLLLADLNILEPVMQRAYGGWDSAAIRGWNWVQWFANWRDQLAAKGTTQLSYDQAFAPMDALFAFQRDNHTQIPLIRTSTSDGSQTALLATPPTAPCNEIRTNARTFPIAADDPGQQVRTAKRWEPGDPSFTDTHYISMPTSRGTPQAIRCGAAWIPLQTTGGIRNLIHNLLRLAPNHDPTRIERLGDGIVYARLPTFDASNYEQISRQGWAERQPGDRVLIVDLRNNGGGDAQYGLDALQGWIDPARMIHFADLGSQVNSSCLYPALKWGYLAQTGQTGDPTQKPFLQELLDRIAQPYPAGCPHSMDITPSRWTYLQHRFNPKPSDLRILALVDSHCASDCELITEMLASLPETIIIGANTYGVCQMIQPGYSVLPNTGLRYRIALGRDDPYGDNRSVDGYGLDVDVTVPEVDTLTPTQLRTLAQIVAHL
jgi:hypothetical protein